MNLVRPIKCFSGSALRASAMFM